MLEVELKEAKNRKYVKDKGRQPKISESSDFAYFLGVILGDASIFDGRISLTVRDPEFRTKFIDIGRKVVGKEPRYSIHAHGNFIEVAFYSPTFIQELASWFGCTGTLLTNILGSRSKNSDRMAFAKIFAFVQTSRDNAKAFIEGFYDSEGSCHQFKRTRLKSGDTSHLQYRGRIRIYNTNKELLRFIQTIMLDFFKIESRIYLQHHKEVGTFWSSNKAQPFIKRTKDVWVLCITKRTDVREFARSIYSCIPRKNFNLNI